METERMSDYSCSFLSLLFCFSFWPPPHINVFLYTTRPFHAFIPFLHSTPFSASSSSVFFGLLHYVLHFFFFFFCLSYSFFPTPPANSFSLFIYPIFSSSLSLRSQWVWLRGECGVPPLSLAIKAMPTPRLHMSSRPSKRGGVLLIRSVSHNANTPRQLSICRCMFWLHACCFVCLLSVCVTGKICPSYQVFDCSWKHTFERLQVFQQVHSGLFHWIEEAVCPCTYEFN